MFRFEYLCFSNKQCQQPNYHFPIKLENNLRCFQTIKDMKNNKQSQQFQQQIRFNLFNLDLDSEKSPKSWMWCKFNPDILKSHYIRALKTTPQNDFIRLNYKKLDSGMSTFGKHLIQFRYAEKYCYLPIKVLKLLCSVLSPSLKEKVIASITSLYFTNRKSKPIKPSFYLTSEFAEIIGAFVADGYFCGQKGGYYIKLCEGNRTPLTLINIKLNNIFNFKGEITFSKEDNTWHLWMTNRVICRYFECIFGFKPGKKADIVRMPELIRNSNMDIQRAFVRGVFTFDGAVKTTGNVAFCTKSKDLMADIEAILKKDGIQYKINYNKNKNAWSLESSSGRDTLLLKKWKEYFLKDTLKYKKIQFFLDELKVDSIGKIEKLFPLHHHTRVTFRDIYRFIQKVKNTEIGYIIKEFNKQNIHVAKTTLYKYLFILNRSHLISKENYEIVTHKGGYRNTVYYLGTDIRNLMYCKIIG